ncbi:DUF4430 domain-containing protein [Streptomyces sp. DSM 42041]|uniref:DUF4430 domain-containing protein n=1 Tax=Streptomyces hazeniae TaxID=3075538 RepID=A0ABU2NMK5_9ACTN|nr:DUF4430 domain-containing protein [Streptomyces sp. DSM 42041]MDT0378210.1 DUF4430 domain-containing protein [Streptomyces sp. DSM 42041]
MKRHTVLRRTALLTAALGLALGGAPAAAAAPGTVAAAANDPITVDLTVQGPNGALFDGPITTTGHDVTTASGGTHHCDGTNNDMNPEPGATPTAALDDAADQENFTWDGTWYPSFDDYFVSTIDGHNGGSAAYWNISVNGTSTPVGGCQFRIEPGDDVAFTWTEM